MIELTYPIWLLALPLPYLIVRFVPAYMTQQQAVQVPFFQILAALSPQAPQEGAVQLKPLRRQRFLLIFIWVMLVLALCKPTWLSEPQTRELSGRDLMVVVDLSGSMATEDFILDDGTAINRLQAVKQVLGNFSEQRTGDRLGLILFGDQAYLQAPFTADHAAWLALLNETQVAMAGPSTHLGDAIGLAIKIFEDNTTTQKVAIVLTDGNDTDSLVPPIDAARVAASRDVRIHMVAMGDPASIGEDQLNMEVIQEVAKLTGGESFLALSTDELNRIYQQIAELEPQTFESFTYRPKVSIHYIPLIPATLIYLFAYARVTVKQLRLYKQQFSSSSATNAAADHKK